MFKFYIIRVTFVFTKEINIQKLISLEFHFLHEIFNYCLLIYIIDSFG